MNLMDEHERVLKRLRYEDENNFLYFLNRGFVELYFREYEKANYYYDKAIKMYESRKLSEEICMDIFESIRLFIEIMRKVEKNIVLDVVENMVNDVLKRSSSESDNYLEIPSIIKKELISLKNIKNKVLKES